MESFNDALNFPSKPTLKRPNAKKCQNKHKLQNEIDFMKTQVYNNGQGSSLKKKLDFNNPTLGFKDKTVQYLSPNTRKLVICEKHNKDRTIKNIAYLQEKFDSQKILRENSANDFKQSMNYFEIITKDKENIFTNPEVRKIDDPTLTSITRFNQYIHQTTIKPYFQINTYKNSFRLLTGSVDNILFWSKIKKGLQILFEVTAILEDTQEGKWKWEKLLLLSDSKTSSKLLVHYYEIDRKLPKLQAKSIITCVGKFMSGNHLQAYKVKECSENEEDDYQRLAFICNRTAEEMALWNETKIKTQF